MENFEFNKYTYIGFLSRNYTLTDQPHVFFIKVPDNERIANQASFFLNNLPKGISVYVETEGNVEAVFLMSAETGKVDFDSDKIAADVDLVYQQFGNEKYALNSTNADIAHKYMSTIRMESFYNLKSNQIFQPDVYDVIATTDGTPPFPATAILLSESFELLDVKKLVDSAKTGVSLDIPLLDADETAVLHKVFFINHKTINRSYALEISFICMYLQSFKAGHLPNKHNLQQLTALIGNI